MSVVQSYNVGGVIDEIKKINFPAHLFPRFTKSFTKGFGSGIAVPALPGTYSVEYVCPTDMELINISIACSGYRDGDYWEAYSTDPGEPEYCLVETMPTREIAESINMGNVLYIVHRLPAGSKVRFDFHNESGTSKTVWPSLRFLR
ncbi:hypothetical protein ACK8P5_25745 (plasmid) [Paenibacillus sp. EC2-1]|uniref:hypothetical protein n=1 Tax=Paenibacillus sp. EC2-1 TaxID=3388665 RepID=UPI003BEEBB35